MKKTLATFKKMKADKEPVSWVTAYDYPMAYCTEKAGIDMILVGDSGGMVQLGYDTTNPVTMDEMITMAKAVRRGAPTTFVIGDMPQGSYEVSNEEAIKNALRFVKEAGCDAIKLEGGKRITERVTAISNAGILTMGHLGLTPQSTQTFGGYRVQCKTVKSFEETLNDALALEKAGAFAILLEAIPTLPGGMIAKHCKIPIYGVGGGANTDGQLVIMHDLLGLYPNFRPHFAKCYIPDVIKAYTEQLLQRDKGALLGGGRACRDDGLLILITNALGLYHYDVKKRLFPSEDYCYPLTDEELSNLKRSAVWLE